ncbi:hypothetical protein LCGC14_2286130, partial [marine sediment metagenome]
MRTIIGNVINFVLVLLSVSCNQFNYRKVNNNQVEKWPPELPSSNEKGVATL